MKKEFKNIYEMVWIWMQMGDIKKITICGDCVRVYHRDGNMTSVKVNKIKGLK